MEHYYKFLKYFVYVILILIIFINLQFSLTVNWLNTNSLKTINNFNVLSNYKINVSDVIIEPKDIRKTNLNIFFIETTCSTKVAGRKEYDFENNGIILNIRQACAIESVAYLNKNHTVYLLYSCPINENIFKKTTKVIIQMFRYTNVKIVKLDMYKYFSRTPVEDLLIKGIIEQSYFPVEHTSDVLRYLTLWKYGGSYFDLDIINIKSIYKLGTNFAGFESETLIGSAVINFESQGIGHELLTQMLQHLNRSFDGSQWTKNGPDVITEILLNHCRNRQKTEENNKILCDGFTIYQPRVFYPVPWNQWEMNFQENPSSNALQQMNDSFTVHFWNKLSSKTSIIIGSKQTYEILADQYCQLTHSILKTENYHSF